MRKSHPNPQKADSVKRIKDLISQSKSIAVVDPSGLKVSQISQLRREIKQAGGLMLIAKNTLFAIARGKPEEQLSGTSAYIFCLSDETSPIKSVSDFAKKHQLPTFKAGFLSDRVLTAAEVAQLASLPAKPVLVSKLIGSLKTPLFQLSHHLNWPASQLARTIHAIAKLKEVSS